ncbi:hypothetical protein BN1723_002218 [Verticillium longisporum]|uniref:RRM domain-containing protein n=2 Tax=Verticillium longisporum TaxID=100787 RepID=A0A0G4L2Q9_VERLO|nr:hypothetical protein BN1723_002218 [Verticillium longisporum]
MKLSLAIAFLSIGAAVAVPALKTLDMGSVAFSAAGMRKTLLDDRIFPSMQNSRASTGIIDGPYRPQRYGPGERLPCIRPSRFRASGAFSSSPLSGMVSTFQNRSDQDTGLIAPQPSLLLARESADDVGSSSDSATSTTCPTALQSSTDGLFEQFQSPSSVYHATPLPQARINRTDTLLSDFESHSGHTPAWRPVQLGELQPRTTTCFRPSNAIAGLVNPHQDPWEVARLKAQHGISVKYRGDPSLPGNHSAAIPDAENCSFWIIDLPPDVTHNQLLRCIRNTGRVHACVINPPDPRNRHYTAAAKIVFFDLWAADKFMSDTFFWGFIVGTHCARVKPNRIKSAPQPQAGDRSRVLIIEGHPSFVNARELTRYFDGKFQYQVDSIIDVYRTEDVGIVEYRFGSYRCQAQTARMAIETEHMGSGSSGLVYDVFFGRDPCDVKIGSFLRFPGF